MRNVLKQSATLHPFMRKLIFLTVIAEWASQHNVIHIMPWPCFSTTNRYGVVKLKDVFPVFFLKLLKAVVASILLRFQFDLNLFSSKCARNGFTSSSSPLVCQSVFNRMGAAILSLIGIVLLFVVFPVYCIFLFFMGLIVAFFICTELVSMGLSIGFVVYIHLFFVCSIPRSCFSSSVLSRFRMFTRYLFQGITTYLAIRAKVFSSIAVEVFRGSRKPALAWACALLLGYILGYSVHTDEPTFHSSCQGMLAHRSGNTLLPPHSTIKPLPMQLQGVLYAIH